MAQHWQRRLGSLVQICPKMRRHSGIWQVCSKWLKLFFSHRQGGFSKFMPSVVEKGFSVVRLMSIWCLGPESGELQLQPWAETAEAMKVEWTLGDKNQPPVFGVLSAPKQLLNKSQPFSIGCWTPQKIARWQWDLGVWWLSVGDPRFFSLWWTSGRVGFWMFLVWY